MEKTRRDLRRNTDSPVETVRSPDFEKPSPYSHIFQIYSRRMASPKPVETFVGDPEGSDLSLTEEARTHPVTGKLARTKRNYGPLGNEAGTYGGIDTKKSGGMVRGSGRATKGVRPCKIC